MARDLETSGLRQRAQNATLGSVDRDCDSSGANDAKIARLEKEVEELKSAVHRSRSPRMRPRQQALPQPKLLALPAQASSSSMPVDHARNKRKQRADRSKGAAKGKSSGGKVSGEGKGVMSFERIMDTLGQTQAVCHVPSCAQGDVLQVSERRVQQCFSLWKEAFMCRLWCRRQAVQLLPLSPVDAQLIVSF